jgi:hypothetical protein
MNTFTRFILGVSLFCALGTSQAEMIAPDRTGRRDNHQAG